MLLLSSFCAPVVNASRPFSAVNQQNPWNIQVVPVSVCGRMPSIPSIDTLTYNVFGTKNDTMTAKGLASVCSGGKALIDGSVYPDIIDVPCPVGQTPETFTPDESACDYISMAAYVDKYLSSSSPASKKFSHRVYVVPEFCPWAGMGQIGCAVGSTNTNICKAWINSLYIDKPSTLLHELGHNFGLDHSGTKSGGEYGDMTDSMGACCDTRCFGAVHSEQLNWTKPVASLDYTKLNKTLVQLKHHGDYVRVTYPNIWIYIQYNDAVSWNNLKERRIYVYTTKPWKYSDAVTKFPKTTRISDLFGKSKNVSIVLPALSSLNKKAFLNITSGFHVQSDSAWITLSKS
jgi:hypothetical protein